MRIEIVTLPLLLAVMCGCSQPQTAPLGDQPTGASVTAWPRDWSEQVGETLTLEGTAADARLGALLLGDGGSVWIDGLESWPEGFYSGGDKGKKVRVTGTVIRKDDVPVFVRRPGELPRAGVPVDTEEEREKVKWRYLLSGAKWTVID